MDNKLLTEEEIKVLEESIKDDDHRGDTEKIRALLYSLKVYKEALRIEIESGYDYDFAQKCIGYAVEEGEKCVKSQALEGKGK